ncbi:MAG: glycosyltransferase, partial [Acidobacteria bacterium]|nr:glycosyltransferase [Acidobacteriota bacterium]
MTAATEPDIVFPEVTRAGGPEVSILVVTYGAPEVVKKCLALLAGRTPPRAEVIVVDNGGPDSPGAFLSSHVHGATIVRNPRNVGFGAANGQAAALARAPLLFLLNPDAFVHEGWLPPLLETAAHDPRAGAIAPRVLNADGTLQESGGLLFDRGLTRFNGFGEDPSAPAHLLPRVADYASASALLVRTRLFHEVGGFDPRYAPAYYEDVDLQLAFQERGFHTRLEPRSVVTHLRGASGGGSFALWHRNRELFFGRWAALCARRPPDAGDPPDALLAAASRDAPAVARFAVFARGPADAEPLLARLLALWPPARVTLFTEAPPGAQPRRGGATRDAAERLAAQGVECFEGTDVLSARALHYDACLVTSPSDAVSAVLASTQPQAIVVSGDSLESGEALGDLLASHGLPPAA